MAAGLASPPWGPGSTLPSLSLHELYSRPKSGANLQCSSGHVTRDRMSSPGQKPGSWPCFWALPTHRHMVALIKALQMAVALPTSFLPQTYSPRVSTLLPAGPANTTESPSWNTRYWRQNRMFSMRSRSLWVHSENRQETVQLDQYCTGSPCPLPSAPRKAQPASLSVSRLLGAGWKTRSHNSSLGLQSMG